MKNFGFIIVEFYFKLKFQKFHDIHIFENYINFFESLDTSSDYKKIIV